MSSAREYFAETLSEAMIPSIKQEKADIRKMQTECKRIIKRLNRARKHGKNEFSVNYGTDLLETALGYIQSASKELHR